MQTQDAKPFHFDYTKEKKVHNVEERWPSCSLQLYIPTEPSPGGFSIRTAIVHKTKVSIALQATAIQTADIIHTNPRPPSPGLLSHPQRCKAPAAAVFKRDSFSVSAALTRSGLSSALSLTSSGTRSAPTPSSRPTWPSNMQTLARTSSGTFAPWPLRRCASVSMARPGAVTGEPISLSPAEPAVAEELP